MFSCANDSCAALKSRALSIASAARRAISCARSSSGVPKRRRDSPVPSEIVPSSLPRVASGTTMYESASSDSYSRRCSSSVAASASAPWRASGISNGTPLRRTWVTG